MSERKSTREIWTAFGQALGAEPRDHATIQGASGLVHTVEAISVDDRTGRVIVIAAEPNPRMAALLQMDLQAKLPDARVIVARPILFDIASTARRFVRELGLSEIDFAQLAAKLEHAKAAGNPQPSIEDLFGGVFAPIVLALNNITLPPLGQIVAVVQQMALLNWHDILSQWQETPARFAVPLRDLVTLDTTAVDRSMGICPVPLYEFTETDWEMFLSGTRIEDLTERLKVLGIYQYFFPPPDQIALGITERGQSSSHVDRISTAIGLSPSLGHPLGATELVSKWVGVPRLIEELQSQGLLVEGEFGFQVTKSGVETRATVKFRPRESLLTKLLQRMNLNFSVSPRDLFPP